MPQLRRKKAPRISRRRPPQPLSMTLNKLTTEVGKLRKLRIDPELGRAIYEAEQALLRARIASKAQEQRDSGA